MDQKYVDMLKIAKAKAIVAFDFGVTVAKKLYQMTLDLIVRLKDKYKK